MELSDNRLMSKCLTLLGAELCSKENRLDTLLRGYYLKVQWLFLIGFYDYKKNKMLFQMSFLQFSFRSCKRFCRSVADTKISCFLKLN